jgi:hypothetical protein
MAKREIGKWNGAENILFECFVAHANRHYKVVCGPDDDGKPCFTLMKPNEVIKEGCWE